MNGTEEEFVPEEEAAEGPAALKSLREKLKKAVEEKQEYLEAWQRERADFVNYKKGEAAAHGEKELRMQAQFVKELLPALDVLELSLRHEENPAMRMLEKELLDALKRLGVERFGKKGEEFDPRRHEALAKRGEDHIVESVERSGYAIGELVIRPAQVII